MKKKMSELKAIYQIGRLVFTTREFAYFPELNWELLNAVKIRRYVKAIPDEKIRHSVLKKLEVIFPNKRKIL